MVFYTVIDFPAYVHTCVYVVSFVVRFLGRAIRGVFSGVFQVWLALRPVSMCWNGSLPCTCVGRASKDTIFKDRPSPINHLHQRWCSRSQRGLEGRKGADIQRRTTLVRSPVIQLTRMEPRTDRFGPFVLDVHKPVCSRRTKHLAHRDTFWHVYYSSRPSHGSRCGAIRKRVGEEMPDRGEDSNAVVAGGRVSKGE